MGISNKSYILFNEGEVIKNLDDSFKYGLISDNHGYLSSCIETSWGEYKVLKPFVIKTKVMRLID
jgi:hypothetical protein